MRRFVDFMRYALVALTVAGVAHAGKRPVKEIVRIHTAKKWNLRDPICFHRDREILACGRVVGTASYLVAISVDNLNEKVRRGDRIFVSAAGPGREPTSYGDSYVVTRTVPLFLHGISTGLVSTGSIVVPELQIQASLGRGWLLGIMPLFTQTSTTKVLGTFLTVEGYFSGNAFDGFFAQAGAGLYSLAGSAAGSSVSWVPGGQLSLGWRYVARWGLNFGLAAGAQYTSQSSIVVPGATLPSGAPISDWQPLLRVDLGIAF